MTAPNYFSKRIAPKSGALMTERDMAPEEVIYLTGTPPRAGDVIELNFGGSTC